VPTPFSRRASGTGSPRSTAATASANAGMVATILVSATGTSAFTVIPYRVVSAASVRAMPTMPAFTAE